MALSNEILDKIKAKGGGGKPPPEKGPPAAAGPVVEDAEYAADEEAIASDMLDAYEARDPAALASALKAFIDVCRPMKE